MSKGEIMRARDDAPEDVVPAAEQRQRILGVVVLLNQLVVAAEQDRRGAGLAPRELPPVLVLAHHGRGPDGRHEGGDEAVVVVERPVDDALDGALERRRALRQGLLVVVVGIDGLLGGGVENRLVAALDGLAHGRNSQRRRRRRRPASALRDGAVDGLPQAPLGEAGEQALGDEPRREDEAAGTADVLGADEAGGRQQDERLDHVREGGREVRRDPAPEAVADDAQAGLARPAQLRRRQHQQDLRHVEAGVVLEVAGGVRVASAE